MDFKSRTRGTASFNDTLYSPIYLTKTMDDLTCVNLRVRTWFFAKQWRCTSYGYNRGKVTCLRRDNIFGRYCTS